MERYENTQPVTYLKTRTAELLREVKRSRRPILITQKGVAEAVVLDVRSYEALRDGLSLLQLVLQGEEDIQAGRTATTEQAFQRADRAIRRKR